MENLLEVEKTAEINKQLKVHDEDFKIHVDLCERFDVSNLLRLDCQKRSDF